MKLFTDNRQYTHIHKITDIIDMIKTTYIQYRTFYFYQ